MKTSKVCAIILSAMMLTGAFTACNSGEFTQEFINTGDLFNRPTTMDSVPTAVDLSEVESFAQSVAPASDQFELASWTSYNYTEITLSDDASAVTKAGDYEAGVIINGNDILIDEEGVYSLTGTLSDGRVVVAKKGNVRVILNGVNITCKTSAPLAFLKGALKVLTLAEGTENTLFDAETYTKFYDNDGIEVATEAENKINGCLYSQHELTINGSGDLKVTSNSKNGISGKSKIKIADGNILVSAENNAIRAKAVDIVGGSVVVTESGNDGIKSLIENDAEEGGAVTVVESSGYVNVLGGTVVVNSDGDGIQAESMLRISGEQTFVVVKSGCGLNGTLDEAVSNKGLKSSAYLLIDGGDVCVEACDDALHADKGIVILGGKCVASTLNKGINSTVGVKMNGGRVEVKKSGDGLEALNVNIMGGTLKITSSGNGIKCEHIDEQSLIQSTADCALIVGGDAVVDVSADGDAIESDGKILIEGGQLFVDGPVASDKSVIEAKQGVAINGGTVVACGPLGRIQDPVTQSSGCSVSLALNKAVSAGSAIKLCDASGKILISREVIRDCRSFLFADARIVIGETYTVIIGDKTVKQFTVSEKYTLVGANV